MLLLIGYGPFEGCSSCFQGKHSQEVDRGPLDPEVEGDTFLQNVSNDLSLT
jgi:hypothetical protein